MIRLMLRTATNLIKALSSFLIILSVMFLVTIIILLWIAANRIKAYYLLLGGLVYSSVRLGKSKIMTRFEDRKQSMVNVVITIPVLILIYLIPFTFMLGNKDRTIIGIILQILAGAILIIDQISSNRTIRKQVNRIIKQPTLFALLITIILLPFAISIWIGLSDAGSDRWSVAGGMTIFTVIAYGMFIISLTVLSKIKWLRSRDYIPATNDKFDISNLSLRNVGILLVILLTLTFLLGYLLNEFYGNSELWFQILLAFLAFFYGLMVYPVLIISLLYILVFALTKFTFYVNPKKLGIWFWIFLFIIWTWGGLLLIMKEFK